MCHKRQLNGVAALLLSVATLVGTAAHPSTQAQVSPAGLPPARMVAVAPIADEVGFHEDLAAWASTRLVLLLSRQGIPVVPLPQVEAALQEARLGPSAPLSLAATDDLAQRVGAEIVVSGRVIDAETEWDGADTRAMPTGPPESTVTLAFQLRRGHGPRCGRSRSRRVDKGYRVSARRLRWPLGDSRTLTGFASNRLAMSRERRQKKTRGGIRPVAHRPATRWRQSSR
jgi:hypothetical protein